uniref:Uncharacterized protein n=1 Tax=Arion vulgaris TaxID=1028688 RepID=A0A0B6YWE0_9EUPU
MSVHHSDGIGSIHTPACLSRAHCLQESQYVRYPAHQHVQVQDVLSSSPIHIAYSKLVKMLTQLYILFP